ncbi:MAG: hypothetical protein EON60_00450 [Alphaproteobacteria bacterium]|nr:MAG: hypothetical protein EON60_00450 [Alphaproteobacteria bacterium]
MRKTKPGRRTPAPRKTTVTIDGKPATPALLEALNKPLMHVNPNLIGQSLALLYSKGVGLLGQIVVQWKTLKPELNPNQRDEVTAVLKREGLRPDMTVRGWENASVDMDVAAAWG